ncbi:MAG: hypothetical protein ACRD9L_09075, partial [Bryobacteraceae bacterium]
PHRRPEGEPVMKILAVSLILAAATAFAAPPSFSVELVPVDSSALPALHSYSVAEAGGKWLLLGGRTTGLHLFVQSSNGGATPPPDAFPAKMANTNAWVIDPAAGKAWSEPLAGLPATIADQLSANNAQFIQDGNWLYIAGGYGKDSKTGNTVTFPYLTAIQVRETIDAIVAHQPLNDFVQQTSIYVDCPLAGTNTYNACVGPATQKCQQGPGWAQCVKDAQAACAVEQQKTQNQCIAQVQSGNTQGLPTDTGYYATVTGGGMRKVGNVYYLVFGQDFEGLYSVAESDYGKWPVNQVYTQRVVALSFTPKPVGAAVLRVIQQDPNDFDAPYNRRDVNVLPDLTPDGTARISIHGGVFVPGQDTAYRQPIFIDKAEDPANATVTVDTSYQQMMSQYECATLSLFDRTGSGGGNMIDVSFGGISLYYLDSKTHKLKMDEGLPFINTLSSLSNAADGSWSEYARAQPLPARMGTDAAFIPAAGVESSPNGVIYLDALKQRTKVGYVFGGIVAERGEAGGSTDEYSKASNLLYEVWVDPSAPPANYWVPAAPPVRTAPRTVPTPPASEGLK